MIFKNTQKGQALVLIALAAVGLFAFAALAIDGSIVFSDRRHAQNAADTAAYAAALARVRDSNPGLGLWKQFGIDRAITNGYDASDGVTEVEVYTCLEWKTSPDNPTGADCKGLPAGAVPDEYILVRIKSTVKMTFARVIGRYEVINYTDAVVHAAPIDITEWFDGMAFVSANPTCAGPGEFGPFDFGGNSTTIVNNSGIFVNSACDPAINDTGNSNSITTSEGVCVVGGVPSVNGFYDSEGNPVPPDDHCGDQIDISQYWMPDSDPTLLAPYCDVGGNISGSGGNYTATPGSFGGGPFPDRSPSGTLKLQKGIYCLNSGISLNGNWNITTDLNGNGLHDPATEGVFFYIPHGDVSFNGGSNMFLFAMSAPTGGWPSQLLDYLFYIPASNPADVDITGNNGSTFTGMVLAPTSAIQVIGNGDALHLYTQIIGYNTRISGSGTIDITYDPDAVPPAIIMPKISPTE